jgi:hypothetical protein
MNALTKASTWWPLIIIASAVVAVLVEVEGVLPSFRPAIILWFFLICPGMALVRLLRIADHVAELTVAIALSVTLDAIVAETMVMTGRWSPKWALILLAALSVLGAVLQIITVKGDAGSRETR